MAEQQDAHPAQLPATGYIRARQLLKLVPFGRSTLWLKVSRGEFPAPVRLSQRVTAWRCEAIREWIDAKAAQSHTARQ